MKDDYDDILSRIKEPPVYYDVNGCPRWEECPMPDLMGRIRCQYCWQEFIVCLGTPVYHVNLRLAVARFVEWKLRELEGGLFPSKEDEAKQPFCDGKVRRVVYEDEIGHNVMKPEWHQRKRYELVEQWHYGDPPAHGCIGDTMNSVPEYEWKDFEEARNAYEHDK